MNPISSAAIIKAPYFCIRLSPSRLCSCNARERILGLHQLTILGIRPSEEGRERQDDEDDRTNGELGRRPPEPPHGGSPARREAWEERAPRP
jgi:hypothetical protein